MPLACYFQSTEYNGDHTKREQNPGEIDRKEDRVKTDVGDDDSAIWDQLPSTEQRSLNERVQLPGCGYYRPLVMM